MGQTSLAMPWIKIHTALCAWHCALGGGTFPSRISLKVLVSRLSPVQWDHPKIHGLLNFRPLLCCCTLLLCTPCCSNQQLLELCHWVAGWTQTCSLQSGRSHRSQMVDREAQHEASASLSALWLIDFQHGSDYQHFGFNGEANVLQNLATKPPPEINGCTFEILAIFGHVETPHWRSCALGPLSTTGRLW